MTGDGTEHGASIENNHVAVFLGLLLSSIKEFRFQVRPYYWVEFDNVSLHPGQMTNVTVVSPDASLRTEK